MGTIRRSPLRKKLHQGLRQAAGLLPASARHALDRNLLALDTEPDAQLELKVAESRQELEECFRLLHDSYVASGFMAADASGMRITPFHALPTTTTICAKHRGRVVGTVSMVREGVFGFPIQDVRGLEPVKAKGGNVAQIAGLAVHPDFRTTGGAVLFPLMKFLQQYGTEYFDTRHFVIAVHPRQIEFYEAVFFFERLQGATIEHYEHANGAPAVGASLDLRSAQDALKAAYRGKSASRNLHRYLFQTPLPNFKLPLRRYYTTNDPVMTPELLDYFFNQKSQLLGRLDDRKKSLLRSVYTAAPYQRFLPPLTAEGVDQRSLRSYPRFSIRSPAVIRYLLPDGERRYVLDVIEMSLSGFQAESKLDLPLELTGEAIVELGEKEHSRVSVSAVRRKASEHCFFFGFKLDEPDPNWRRCVAALESGSTAGDLL